MKTNMPTPATLEEGIALLKAEGFKLDLTWEDDCLYCSKEHYHFDPTSFKIHQRFEFPSGDAGKIHLLAVSSAQYRLRGHLTTPFDVSSFSVPH
jgi:hypothetical protein